MGLADFDFLPSVPQTFWGFPPFLPPPFFLLFGASRYVLPSTRGAPFPHKQIVFYEPTSRHDRGSSAVLLLDRPPIEAEILSVAATIATTQRRQRGQQQHQRRRRGRINRNGR